MIEDYFRLALRSLRRRRLRTWLTLVGIVIGITAVVALVGLGQGLQVAIANIFGSLGADKITVSAEGGFGPPGTGVSNPLTKENLERIENIRGVENGVGRLVKAGKLEFNGIVDFGYVVSMPSTREDLDLIYETFDIEAVQGRLLKADYSKSVLVGYNFYDKEDFYNRQMEPGSSIKVQDKSFEVSGVVKKLGNPIFDNSIYMPEKDMRDIFGLGSDELDVIAVEVQDKEEIERVKEDIEEYLRDARDVREGNEDFSVSTPQEALESVNSTLGAVNIFVYVIAAISILVGGIGIMNSMFMSVTERTRDIGIMKSLGATNKSIFYIFLIESGLLGSIGGIAGVILGAGLSMLGAMALENFLGGGFDIMAQIGPVLIITAVLGSFIVGSLFGTIPALKAAKLHPVDALRK